MNDHWNQAEEDHHRQSHMHWNQYPGTNKAFSPTLPATVPSSSTFISNSRMSSSNDTSLSTGPSFLPQQLVWPTMTTMTMNPSSFYVTGMPSIASQPTVFIPMPVYGCAYPNNSNSGNSFPYPPPVAATQGSYYMIQPPMFLPPQLPVMLPTETTHMQPDIYSSSILRSSSSSHVFPTSFENNANPHHGCLSLKKHVRDDNKPKARDDNKSNVKHETSLYEKDDSFLLHQASERSSQSRSVNHEPLQAEPQHAATANSYRDPENDASIDQQEHQSSEAVAAEETVLLSKPRRALSAYNLFFKDQRELMIRRQEEKEEEEERQGQIQNPKKRCRGGARRRKHGIRFECMAREIAQLWKNVDPHVLSHYAVIAEKDKQRYQQEKEMYMQQCMNIMETTRQQLESTVSDVARQNYLAKAGSAKCSQGIASKKKRKRVE